MNLKQLLIDELKQESANTEKMISCLPEDKFGWKPHDKSMTLQQLAAHIVGLFGRGANIADSDEFDFAKMPSKTPKTDNVAELTSILKQGSADFIKSLEGITDEDLNKQWTMRNGETVFFQMPKYKAMRTSILNHIYHHRGQLGVYLRLLNVPVPGMFGPSADDKR